MYVRRSTFWFKAETCWCFTFLDDSLFLTEICFETNEKANDTIGMEKGGRLSYKVRKDLLRKNIIKHYMHYHHYIYNSRYTLSFCYRWVKFSFGNFNKGPPNLLKKLCMQPLSSIFLDIWYSNIRLTWKWQKKANFWGKYWLSKINFYNSQKQNQSPCWIWTRNLQFSRPLLYPLHFIQCRYTV